VSPDAAHNIDTVGSGSITIVGDPGTNTLTTQLTGLTDHAVLIGAGTDTITKLIPNTAGYVLTDNGAGVDPSWQAPTGIVTINGDSGSITGSTVSIKATSKCGITTSFANSGTDSVLNLTDSAASANTLLGLSAGKSGYSGSFNTGVGQGTLGSITSASANTSLGVGCLSRLTTGQFNVAIGRPLSTEGSGRGYTSSETSNILINNIGTTGESNALRIGISTGTGAGQLNKAFIHGINGVTTSNTKMVTIDSSTSQMGVVTSVPVANGGTGVATLTGLALGSGTSNFTGVTYVPKTAWVPSIEFAGGSTGITYASQVGAYTRIGDYVFLSGDILLTSKGTDTGQLQINLPITATGYRSIGAASLQSVTGLTSSVICQVVEFPNINRIIFQDSDSTGATDISDANITDTSRIRFSVGYWVG
jgi:hypothetical protein